MHSKDPLVSVIVPNFNHGVFVNEAVQSVLNQTLKAIEIIVVDAGSTSQEAVDALRSIASERVRVYFRKGRHLVGSNRNYGIERCRGKYVCCVDADDMIDPTYLEKAYYLAEAGGIDVVSSSYRNFGARNANWDLPEQPKLSNLLSENSVCVSALFRKSLWAEAGGYFDTGLGPDLVAEDWDFWIRLAAAGATFWNINREHLLWHREHEGPSLGRHPENPTWLDQLAKIKERRADLLTPAAIARSDKANEKRDWRAVQIDLDCFDVNDRTFMIFMPWFLVGGTERLFWRVCKAMKGRGWKPVVVATTPSAEGHASSREWFDEAGIEIFSLPDFLPEALRVPFARHLIQTRKPTCIVNGGSRQFYEMLPETKRDHPHIIVADFLFNPVAHAKSHLEFQRHIDVALAEGQLMCKWYLEHGWSEERVHKIAVGVNLDLFQPRERPGELVARHAIRPDEIVVGYIGRMSFEKGPMQFIEMAHQLADVPGLRFLMGGDGVQTNLVRDTIPAIADTLRLEYLGVLGMDDVARYLNLCDILVLPSRFDGRPLIVLEALASGVPVVASDVGGLPDLIRDGENGFLCGPSEVDRLASCVLKLARDPALRKRCAKGARETAEKSFQPDAAFDSIEAIFSGGNQAADAMLRAGLVE